MSDLARSAVARVAADPAARQSAGNVVQSFGTDLFRALAKTDGNLACSPYSVAVALAMTRNGARATTADEMDDVLHSTSLPQLNAGLNALTQHISSLAHERTRPDGYVATVTIEDANSLWGQRDKNWEPAFLDALAESYGAGMHQVDYVADAESARQAINSWTSDRTRERIAELLAPRILGGDTRLVLVNAVYLKAPWAVLFLKHATQDEEFTRADGSTVQVPMMALESHSRVSYARGDGWQAVDLPYDGGELAMAVVVPDAGRLNEVVNGFHPEFWRRLLNTLEPTAVALRMPRWTVRTRADLKDVLSGLGMPTAFTDRADFTGMTHDDRLKIAAVVHEAFVAVDEDGTEAAAATAVVAVAISMALTTVTLTIDRPFLFFLHDTETGTPLFIGRVSDPTVAP